MRSGIKTILLIAVSIWFCFAITRPARPSKYHYNALSSSQLSSAASTYYSQTPANHHDAFSGTSRAEPNGMYDSNQSQTSVAYNSMPGISLDGSSQAFSNHTDTGNSPTAIYERISKSTVLIMAGGNIGSGFVVAPGVVISNYHVIDGAQQATIEMPASREYHIVTGILAFDSDHDLIALSVPTLQVSPLSLGNSSSLKVGQKAYALGNPGMLENTFSEGIISGLHRGLDYLQVTTPISGGSSGGPIVDARGKVIAVAVMYLKESQNLNFAVPVDYVHKLLEKIVTAPGLPLPSLPPMAKAAADLIKFPNSSYVPPKEVAPFSESLWMSYFESGKSAKERGDLQEAVQMFKLATAESFKLGSVNGRLNDSMNNLARCMLAQKNYAGAESLLKCCIYLDNKLYGESNAFCSRDMQSLAFTYYKQKKWEQAELSLTKALAMEESLSGLSSPSVLDILSHLSLVYESQGKKSQADAIRQKIESSKTASAPAEDLPEVTKLASEGQRCVAKGDYGNGIKLLEESLRLDANNKYAKERLAEALALLAENQPTQRSLRYLHQSLAVVDDPGVESMLDKTLALSFRDPRSAGTRIVAANIARNLGDLLGSAVELRAAAKIDPENTSINIMLGDAYADIGLVDLAHEQFDKALFAEETAESAKQKLSSLSERRPRQIVSPWYFRDGA